MTHLQSDSILIAGLIVALVTAFAAIGRMHRQLATMILGAVALWLIAVIVVSSGITKTDTGPDPNTNTSPPTITTPPTISYPPAPEPTSGATTGTTSTVTTATAPPPQSTAGLTETTITHPQRPVEPLPPTPMPLAPKPDTVELKPEGPATVPDARLVYERQVKRALALGNSGDWQGTADAWEQLIRDHAGPNRAFNASAYYHLGIAYKNLSDWSRAADAFNNAFHNDKREGATRDLKSLGECYVKLDRRDEAKAVYRRLLGINPNDRVSRDLLTVLERKQ
jgi:TolA-binding protein